MTKVFDAYIAGFFDGEGHVQNHKRSPRIVFTQVEREVLDQILEAYPDGRIYSLQNRAWMLNYHGSKAIDILKAMLPYLIVKRLEVQYYLNDYTEL